MSPFLNQLSDELKAIWGRLGRIQRGLLVGLLVLAVGLAVAFLGWSQAPEYAVVYTGLDDADAAQIVEKLQEAKIPYQLGNDGSILVPREQVHEVRLTMAGEGLPKGGSIGFEVFDGSMLGMTEFSQEVNYRRALEGELARTISSLEAVDQARVHLVIPKQSLYVSQQVPPSASVVIKLSPSATLTPAQVRSIRYLVSSSVEGLQPEDCTIVDTAGNTLAAGGEGVAESLALETSAQQLRAQSEYERAMEMELTSMLEQLVGPGKAVVRVSAEIDWDKVETVSESYAPEIQTGVLRSAQESVETYVGSTGPGEVPVAGFEANVGAAAQNAPEGLATSGQSGSWERRESIQNYEISRLEQKVVKAPGSLRRITVSALVDGITDPQVIADIEEALAAAVGISEARGDVISVKGLPFDRTYLEEEAAAMEQARRESLYWNIGKAAAVALGVLLVLVYVRSMLNTLRPPLPSWARGAVTAGEPALGSAEAPALETPDEGVLLDAQFAKRLARQLAEVGAPETSQEGEGLPREELEALAVRAASDTAQKEEEPEEPDDARLARERIESKVLAIARSNPQALAEVVREWLSSSD